MEFFKSVTGKVVSGLVALGVIAAGISWWQMDPDTRQMLLSGTGRILGWFGIMLALPWASFAIISRVAKLDSNVAGGVLVGTYTVLETFLLALLFHFHLPGATAWTFLLLGGLVAAVYNLLICDWIAEKV